MQSKFSINNGWLKISSDQTKAKASHGQSLISHQLSPHHDQREQGEISLLVIHNISLPPGKFGSHHITDLFLGRLDPSDDPSFADIYQLKVSAHCLIRRNGEVIQYVPFDKRAWHAGVSCFDGRERCNDFSIGIELEGTDSLAYTDAQYCVLENISQAIMQAYPKITKDRIKGHCDIAPERKTDPGESFDWVRYKSALNS
ncbi:1,6-anhydro-N-acetylmuramyl-L-alanine amidase AmpD [Thalassotalea aquiviva]|uniref:1,6-anhydro-N-acetylmuramyl-L-alanine amidase AmpD n=1 Tax=Thalassotalea aquiviva TaxID=3242415 RepID=UPI00352A56C5